MPIRLLSDHVSSMIAAGEVVERPASVVKELVENSLDAGASRISVEVSGGGVESIRVADDGCGIPSGEAELAFERFATSKLRDVGDLDAIGTLGFRGEALPSIASVAHVSLVTRAEGEDVGVRLRVEEGEVVERVAHGSSVGSVMTVSRLFWNVPARRKFLRTAATETAHIQALVTRYALAYPEVGFSLRTGRSEVVTPGSGGLREAVAAVYGAGAAGSMLEIEGQGVGDGGGVVVDGMVGQPGFDRANRGYMSFFVNRRWVQSRMLGFALEQAYRGFLKERRFPVGVVNVRLGFDEVDVNAHPAKTEVRFRNGDRVFSAIQRAVRETLVSDSPVPAVQRSAMGVGAGSGVGYERAGRFWAGGPFGGGGVGAGAGVGAGVDGVAVDGGGDGGVLEVGVERTHRVALPALRVLGQVRSTYIAAEGPDGMYLIDQHAAHERVMFERIRADALRGGVEWQSLLEPIVVELDAGQQGVLESEGGVIAGLGLRVEPFGGSLYLVRGVPGILVGHDVGRAFVDMLDEMQGGGDVESWGERAAYSLSCHAAVRAGKVMTHEEMSALVRDLEGCEQPHTCPHGRPTVVHLSVGYLEREFGRR